MRRALLMLVLGLLAAAEGQGLHIGVVELDPQAAWRLAAAAEAALAEVAGGDAADAATVEPVVPEEPLAVPSHVCGQATHATAALVGGGGTELAAAAAARAGLPLLLVQPTLAPATWEALALYPHEDVLIEACIDLVREKGWRRAVLLHAGSARPAALVAPDDEPLALLARQLPPGLDDAYLRNVLLVLKKAGETNFIVWCDAECAVSVLDAAQRVGLLAERHSYIVLTLELHTQPLHDYSHGGANVTGLMLFDPESKRVLKAMRAWRSAYRRRMGEAFDPAEAAGVQRAPPTALLLAYDAATLLAEATAQLRLPVGAGGDCALGVGAFHADTLLNQLHAAAAAGTTGALQWDAEGRRRGVALRVVELARGGRLEAAGVWASGAGVTWTRRPRPAPPLPPDSLANRTFKVLIAKSDPYVMRRESTSRLSGNAQYEGFCIELIDKLATMLGFNYTFVEQKDGAYGVFDETTKQWNGMVRELRDNPDIEFAITDLTITAEREKGVDFTTPFMNLGISILFRKPKPPEPDLFAFLLPFSKGVWLCLGLAYVGTSLVLYVVGRLCPEEWQNPYPCIEEPDALENQFTLANALWFNLGAVLLQGSEIAPVAYGSRAVASVWWVFALVITSSYTANLASLLATKSSTELIHNAEELAKNQLGIKYGAKANGTTFTFFEHSQSALYQDMFKHMNENRHEMPGTNEDGIKKVMEENYAFLMESTSIEYTIERNCALTKVGDLLDSKGYGIAMKKNSTYRQALNLALLNLQETGVLREMKHTWWKEKHGGGACNVVEDFANTKLEMRNFLGLFLVLVVGCALGVVLSCGNLAWQAARHPREPELSFGRNFLSELRFVFRFERSEKPVRGPLSEADSASAPSGSRRTSPAESARGSRSPQAEDDAGSEASGGRAPAAGPRMRRRSSMHAASLRLARHAAKRHSATPRS